MSRVWKTYSALTLAARNDDVRRAELAWGASIVAEWAHFVALGVFAYTAGGTSAVGIAGLVRLLPAAILAPVAASVGDRFRRERFLLVVLLFEATALAGSAAAAFAGLNVLVYALAAVVGLSTTLIRPTLQALLPSLARTPDELIVSNGATSTIESLGTLVGPLLAGVLIDVAQVGVVFAAAAAVTAAGALLLAPVRVQESLVGGATERSEALRKAWSGFESMAASPGPRLVLGLMVVQTFVRGCLNVLIVVAAFRILDAGAGAVGYMTAAIGVGGLAGALRAMTLTGRRLASSFALALVGWGVPIVLITPHPELFLALLLLAVVGAANSIEDVAGFTLMQRLIPEQSLNLVLAAFWGTAMGAVAVGSVVAPTLVHLAGPRLAFLLVGGLLPVVTLVVYRSLARLDDIAAPNSLLELIEGVPMFAPLSLATKERLARTMQAVTARAGKRVIVAGDTGDRFYIIESGRFDVDAGDRHRSLGPGESFGEIALLRDVPRTATVTASTDGRLYALERDHFLAAVTGHSSAERLGQRVVDSHLGAAPVQAAGS